VSNHTAPFALTSIQQRLVRHARAEEQTTPDWWDHDCRCCLHIRAGFQRSYHIRGGVQVIVIRDEEIHADHTDAEIAEWFAKSEAHS
jgi:hypothetical protein